MPALLESENNAFLLVGVHFGKDGCPLHGMPERFIPQRIQLIPAQHIEIPQPNQLPYVPRHQMIITGDDFQLHPQFFKRDDGFLNARLGWVEKQKEAYKRQFALIFSGIRMFLRGHLFDRYAQDTIPLGAP